jgi:hypothetical protein
VASNGVSDVEHDHEAVPPATSARLSHRPWQHAYAGLFRRAARFFAALPEFAALRKSAAESWFGRMDKCP